MSNHKEIFEKMMKGPSIQLPDPPSKHNKKNKQTKWNKIGLFYKLAKPNITKYSIESIYDETKEACEYAQKHNLQKDKFNPIDTPSMYTTLKLYDNEHTHILTTNNNIIDLLKANLYYYFIEKENKKGNKKGFYNFKNPKLVKVDIIGYWWGVLSAEDKSYIKSHYETNNEHVSKINTWINITKIILDENTSIIPRTKTKKYYFYKIYHPEYDSEQYMFYSDSQMNRYQATKHILDNFCVMMPMGKKILVLMYTKEFKTTIECQLEVDKLICQHNTLTGGLNKYYHLFDPNIKDDNKTIENKLIKNNLFMMLQKNIITKIINASLIHTTTQQLPLRTGYVAFLENQIKRKMFIFSGHNEHPEHFIKFLYSLGSANCPKKYSKVADMLGEVGFENLNFGYLKKELDIDELKEWEYYFIRHLNTVNKGYNMDDSTMGDTKRARTIALNMVNKQSVLEK